MSTANSHRRHQKMHAPRPKCTQCNVEPRLPERADGLGIKCAAYKDESARKVAEHKAATTK